MLKKIETCAEKFSAANEMHKETLKIVYSMVYTKIIFLKNDSENNRLQNLTDYLSSTKKEIKDYEKLIEIINKQNSLNAFSEQIRKIIESAKTMIKSVFEIDIPEIERNLNFEINKLIEDVLELQKKAKKN